MKSNVSIGEEAVEFEQNDTLWHSGLHLSIYHVYYANQQLSWEGGIDYFSRGSVLIIPALFTGKQFLLQTLPFWLKCTS